MAIQMRRGNYTDFDPNQMVPGEFAVSNSDGNKRLFLCFARPGDVIEIPTVESVVDVHEVEEIRDEALEAKDQAVEAAEIAKYNTFTSISATINNSVGTPSVSVVKLSEAPNNSFRFDFRNLRGVQGIQGKQGVSVVDSYIDDNNHLIIVYSDSTQAHPHTDDAGNIGLNVVPLTKAQYDALSDAEKMDPEIFYWIKDMNGGTYGMVIGGGTSNYNELKNKPSINGVTLQGALTSSNLGIELETVYEYMDMTIGTLAANASKDWNPGLPIKQGYKFLGITGLVPVDNNTLSSKCIITYFMAADKITIEGEVYQNDFLFGIKNLTDTQLSNVHVRATLLYAKI